MPSRIEDYAVIGNCETLALVGRDGSIDWLCLPRFDSAACFAALLGESKHGRWLIAPARRRRPGRRAAIAATRLSSRPCSAPRAAPLALIDFMARREGACDIVRLVRGLQGDVAMRMELIARFDYGSIVPWVSQAGRRASAVHRRPGSPAPRHERQDARRGLPHPRGVHRLGRTGGELRSQLVAVLHPGARRRCARPTRCKQVQEFWSDWAAAHKPCDDYADAALRSLLTLKALAHWTTGGIVAAGTTSLPEQLGGSRNWDYRYCWLRDATFTLLALTTAGLPRRSPGVARMADCAPSRALRTMCRRCTASQASAASTNTRSRGCPAIRARSPVRVGNAAVRQLQLDVYGEVLDAFYVARRAGLGPDADSWALEQALVSHLETIWREPDEGIWEVRGGARQFTHSKVMAWVAFDRAVRSIEEFGLEGPLERWRLVRSEIHDEVCQHGFDEEQNAFVQSFGATDLDASLLMIPLVGFLPPDDERVRGTVAAIERRLIRDGLVLRYDTGAGTDGLPAGRRRLPRLQLLARGQLRPARPPRRGARAVRASAGLAQRRRAPGGGIRSRAETPARKFSAGLLASGADQHRAQSRRRAAARRICARASRSTGREPISRARTQAAGKAPRSLIARLRNRLEHSRV